MTFTFIDMNAKKGLNEDLVLPACTIFSPKSLPDLIGNDARSKRTTIRCSH